MSAAGLAREAADAGVGMGRLMRFDPQWWENFDASGAGFLRSFVGPLLALPFFLTVTVLTLQNGGEGVQKEIWAAGIAHLLDAVLYPVVIGLLARPLGLGHGFGGFIVVVNWSSLFLNALAALASLLTLAGEVGMALFSMAWLALIAASLFLVYRAAQETLSREIAPPLMAVVLSVAVGYACSQGMRMALGLAG